MTAPENPFTSGGAAYAAGRPTYPETLADALADRCSRTEHALDVGCGNGQLSVLLADRFERVTATDSSRAQLDSAAPHPAVTYREEPAERIGLADGSVDLVTAAQAAHWFDLDTFYAEVRRVGQPSAVLALVSYGVPAMSGRLGERLSRFYWQDIHDFWPAERCHVEEGYHTLAFPFEERELPELAIERMWDRDELLAYVHTWSAVRRAVEAGEGERLRRFEADLNGLWQKLEHEQAIRWPIVGRIGTL